MLQTVRIKSHFRYGYTIYELTTLILHGVPLHGLNGKYEFKCFMMLKKSFRFQGPVILKTSNVGKKADIVMD